MKSSQWFPGNMARTVRLLREDLKVIDLIVELLDARIPHSSRIPYFSRIAGNKQRLILLNKADLGEKQITAGWLSYFKEQGLKAISFSSTETRSVAGLMKLLRRMHNRLQRTRRLKRPLRLMITGIPNVGKSTLINYLVKRAVAPAGNRPGITRGRQWVRLIPGVELLDTPGVLWPELNEKNAVPLSVVGALPTGRVDLQQSAVWLLAVFLQREKTGRLADRYNGLEPGPPELMLEQIGAGQGCYLPEGKVDLERAAAMLLRDYQSGLLGRLTLEFPPGDLSQRSETND